MLFFELVTYPLSTDSLVISLGMSTDGTGSVTNRQDWVTCGLLLVVCYEWCESVSMLLL